MAWIQDSNTISKPLRCKRSLKENASAMYNSMCLNISWLAKVFPVLSNMCWCELIPRLVSHLHVSRSLLFILDVFILGYELKWPKIRSLKFTNIFLNIHSPGTQSSALLRESHGASCTCNRARACKQDNHYLWGRTGCYSFFMRPSEKWKSFAVNFSWWDTPDKPFQPNLFHPFPLSRFWCIAQSMKLWRNSSNPKPLAQ